MLQLKNICKSYRNGSGKRTVLHGVNLTVGEGACFLVTGPSGIGKTTLLTIIGTLIRPSGGEMFAGAKELTALPEHFLVEYRRKTFGFIFQQFHLLPHLNVAGNVELPLLPRPLGPRQRRGLVERALEEVGLADRAGSPVRELSGGEQQRVAIARALVGDPAVVLADEPTSNLDAASSSAVAGLFGRMRERRKTVIAVSHDENFIGRINPDRKLLLNQGGLM